MNLAALATTLKPGRRPSREHALGEWLRSQGACELPLSQFLASCFDEQGRFQPEALYQTLQQRGWQIATLQQDTTRQAYGTQLGTIRQQSEVG